MLSTVIVSVVLVPVVLAALTAVTVYGVAVERTVGAPEMSQGPRVVQVTVELFAFRVAGTVIALFSVQTTFEFEYERVGLSITGIVIVAVVPAPTPFVAVTVTVVFIVASPETGAPDITQVLVSSVNPVGRVPDVSAHETAVGLSLSLKVDSGLMEIEAPPIAWAVTLLGYEKVGTVSTVICTLVLVLPAALLAMIVYLVAV